MSVIREIKEGIQYQGADEIIKYTLTTTPWASTPTNTSAKIYSISGETYTDVTTSCMTGSTSVVGDIITLPAIASLTAGTRYRVEVKFTVSGNTYEPFAYIMAER